MAHSFSTSSPGAGSWSLSKQIAPSLSLSEQKSLRKNQPSFARSRSAWNQKIDMLLFDFLQELIYCKDAERLLLRVRDARIEERDEKYFLKAETAGDPLDAARHHQRADVKAVTLHDFSVEKDDDGWKARVLLDI